MNVSRSHLQPNSPLREVFEEDFKSLKPEAQKTLDRLLPKSQKKEQADVVIISTCFYSGFMRWLSKFLGALHVELNTEDLERCKLSKSEIGRIAQLGGSSSSGSLGSLSSSESSGNFDRLEQIDPEYDAEDDGNNGDLTLEGGGGDDGNKTDDDDLTLVP